MAMIKFAGKNNSGNATGVHVNNAGDMYVERVLPERDLTYLLEEEELRDTTAGTTMDVQCDAYKYPVNAIVIETSLDAIVNFILLDGAHINSSNWLYNIRNELISFSVPAVSSKHVFIITDNDIPALDNIKYLKLRYQAASAPTQGNITIKVIHKG